MKITLESTSSIANIERGPYSARVRIWEGQTEDGTPIKAYIAMVEPQTHDSAALAQFERELVELQKDTSSTAIDLRFVL